jgi:hypothetical protein
MVQVLFSDPDTLVTESRGSPFLRSSTAYSQLFLGRTSANAPFVHNIAEVRSKIVYAQCLPLLPSLFNSSN